MCKCKCKWANQGGRRERLRGMEDEGLRVPGDDVVCVGHGREEIERAVVGRNTTMCVSL